MPDFKIEIDVSKLAESFSELTQKIENTAKTAMASLAASTHAKVIELATEKLSTTRDIYTDALSFEQLSENMWVVSLDMQKAGWLEDGRKSGFMEELLRGKSAKTSKDGRKYAIIPFEHSKPPSKQTPSAQRFTQEIKKFLKQQDISYKKIEYNPDGSPKLGLLHSFKKGIGTEIYPSHMAKNEFSKGLSIYQTKDKKTGKVRRDVMTFRVISEKHRSEGLWNHPGRSGEFIIDKAYDWALKEFETVVMPQILENIGESK
jgi:hypothetical protein